MNESMFSQIDLIRQDSKDVRDFVKKVFSDREFKSMSKDTDFIKYLKSIYEGTHLDEEHVKFSNRTQNGTITTGSVQITNETIKEDQDCWDTHKVGNPKTKISSKTGKRVNNCVPKSESVVNEAKEPEVITQLRKIVKDKQNTLVVDTKSKKKVRVDMQSANVMVQVYDALKQQSNKDKFVKSGIVSMGHMAFKLLKKEGVNEGKKRFKRQDGIGKAKYTISYHDGKKKHKDGSDFFDIKIFKNKKDLSDFVGTLAKQGYKLTRESVNETINEGKFKKDDLVYNKRTKTVGIVRDVFKDGGGDLRTDADGVVNIDELEKYNPIKFKHQNKAKVAPSTEKEVSKRGLFNPFKNESVNEIAKFAGWVAIDHKGKRLEIKKSEAKDLYNAKLFAIKKLKVPKSKESMLVIKPGYNESVVNESVSKEAMGIAGFTGTRGNAVQKFIDDYHLDAKKLYKFVSKGKLSDRMDFVTALAGKPGNKYQGKIVGMFGESIEEDKNQITKVKKQSGKSEVKFYDILSKVEKKLGSKYNTFLDKSLKDFKQNPSKYKTNADKEEKLFQLS